MVKKKNDMLSWGKKPPALPSSWLDSVVGDVKEGDPTFF